ncbi:MAG: hypothetical protein IPK79_13160 [Vampirovibrionales bacterium]|nr:hypothetical protein [Vampirovibrionales bacterium]
MAPGTGLGQNDQSNYLIVNFNRAGKSQSVHLPIEPLDFGQKIVLVFLGGFFLFVFSCALLTASLAEAPNDIRGYFFITQAARVKSSTVLIPTRGPASLCVMYTFRDQKGIEHTGKNFNDQSPCKKSANVTELNRLCATKYRPNNIISIHYNSKNPAESFIHKEIRLREFFMILAVPILLFLSLICFQIGKKRLIFSLFNQKPFGN